MKNYKSSKRKTEEKSSRALFSAIFYRGFDNLGRGTSRSMPSWFVGQG